MGHSNKNVNISRSGESRENSQDDVNSTPKIKKKRKIISPEPTYKGTLREKKDISYATETDIDIDVCTVIKTNLRPDDVSSKRKLGSKF